MHFSYSNEGSEFLDDALEIEELPVNDKNRSEMENNELPGKELSDLQKKGYSEDLNFLETDPCSLYGGDLDIRLNPDAYHVDEIDRIGDDAQPDAGEVVYAITIITGEKGIIVEKPDSETL